MVSETCYGTLEIVGSTTTVGPECESAVSELTYELPSVTLNLLSLIKPLPATAAAALRDGVVHLFVCLSVCLSPKRARRAGIFVSSSIHLFVPVSSEGQLTSSSAVAERPRDASCLSVVSFNSAIRRAQSSVISYFRFWFIIAYTNKFSSLLCSSSWSSMLVVINKDSLMHGGLCGKLHRERSHLLFALH